MGTNETNLHRAARKLQRATDLSYQQARQRLLNAKVQPDLDDPAAIAAFVGQDIATLLRRHLRDMHGTIADADASEAALARLHYWDHETGEMGPEHGHGPGDPLEHTLDDGERRCTECGETFNVEEGGTDLSAETGDDDGLCIRCEATVTDNEALAPVQRVSVGHRYDDLSPAKCAGGATVTEVNVDGNPNLVRVELDGGGSLRIDVRRFDSDQVDDDIAEALIAEATTTEAGDLEMLVALSRKVTAVGDPDSGTWALICVTDADTSNIAYVDGRVTGDQLDAWFAERSVPFVAMWADGDADLDSCVASGVHLSWCDDDGYCSFCGHQDNPDDPEPDWADWTAQDERNTRTDLCEACKPSEHPVCPLNDGCVCCADTTRRQAEPG